MKCERKVLIAFGQDDGDFILCIPVAFDHIDNVLLDKSESPGLREQGADLRGDTVAAHSPSLRSKCSLWWLVVSAMPRPFSQLCDDWAQQYKSGVSPQLACTAYYVGGAFTTTTICCTSDLKITASVVYNCFPFFLLSVGTSTCHNFNHWRHCSWASHARSRRP